MTKPDLLVLGAYPPWDMAPLDRDFAVHRLWEAPDREALLAALAPSLRAIATKGELGADAALIDRLPRLELIACYGVGTDAIDLDRARERGVKVTNTPDVLTRDVADMALALILACLRRIPQGDRYVRDGSWRSAGGMGLVTSLTGKTVGILGLGRIGRAVAARAAAFETEIAYYSRAPATDVAYAYHPDPAALAAAADILVVTVAGGPATRNMVNAEVLEALGPQGYLVNVGRGTSVDEAALIAALERGGIAGAGLDVFWNEPAIDARLLGFDNVVVQPHHASGTVETRRAMGQLVRDNLAAHFAGRPLLTPVE